MHASSCLCEQTDTVELGGSQLRHRYAMATSELDSEVEFKRRALQLGVSSTNVDALVSAGFKTFGQNAVSVPYQPGSADESPLVDLLTATLSGEPPASQLSCLRRLFWESHGLVVRDLRLRQEHGSDTVIKKLPTSERVARAEAQKSRLTGITWSPETEPSHRLVDRFVTVLEEQAVTYIRPELCTSRAQETLQVKQTKTFSLGSDGQLRLATKGDDLECSTAGEWRLRMALQRKSLAMDLARVTSSPTSSLSPSSVDHRNPDGNPTHRPGSKVRARARAKKGTKAKRPRQLRRSRSRKVPTPPHRMASRFAFFTAVGSVGQRRSRGLFQQDRSLLAEDIVKLFDYLPKEASSGLRDQDAEGGSFTTGLYCRVSSGREVLWGQVSCHSL